jgi:hypothetical protein
MMLLNLVVIDLASPLFPCPIEGVANCSYATNPMWRGVEHLCDDSELLQGILSRGFFFICFFSSCHFFLKGIEFIVSINKRILLGGEPGDSDSLTNDEMFDVLETPKTIKKGIFFFIIFVCLYDFLNYFLLKGSKLISILYDHTNCFSHREGSCDVPISTRLPSISSQGYSGLSSLIELYISKVVSFTN